MSFILFIAAVIGLNVYDWWKLKRAFLQGHHVAAAVLLVFMLLLLMGPAWMRPLFSRGTQPRFLEQACWIWLAWSFWMFVALVCCDIWNLALLGSQMAWRLDKAANWMVGPRGCVYVAVGFVLFGTLWGLCEAHAIRLRRVEIRSPRVPAEADGFRMALISDLHIGPAITQANLDRTIRLLTEASPDLILSAGDLMDGRHEREARLAAQLAALAPPLGKIAVYGNHDVYTGLDYSRECHRLAGFQLLKDAAARPADWLWIYGEKDPASSWHPGEVAPVGAPSEAAPEGCYRLLLKHRPDPPNSSEPPYDLQLSGHSHGGQIFPFNLLVRLQYRYREGRLHLLKGGMRLYVSPGTGAWGPPFRLLARPEVTLFTFHKE